MKFVVRWILTAVAVMVAAWVVPGMGFVGSDFAAALWTALTRASTWGRSARRFWARSSSRSCRRFWGPPPTSRRPTGGRLARGLPPEHIAL